MGRKAMNAPFSVEVAMIIFLVIALSQCVGG